MACAIAAMSNKKERRIFLTIPPGKGKSRVISAIIAYKAKFEHCKDFTILFSSEILKTVDKEVYDLINSLFDLTPKPQNPRTLV